MPKSFNQKLKSLYIMKMLLERTDENKALTLNQIIDELARYDINAERKSIYDDIEMLKHFGIDVCSKKTKTTGYYIANRTFELAELKLLVDAVQCSRFITHKKSIELIKKIESLTSHWHARSLHRQVYLSERIKNANESIFYNVDKLHSAISENKQVSFLYFDYNTKKEKVLRRNGEAYIASPYVLSWDNENYYLITYSEKYNDFVHYRVDRMANIDILNVPRVSLPEDANFNISDYMRKVFNMFGGDEEKLTIRFDNSLVNPVIDRFGKDINIDRVSNKEFVIRVDVSVSPTFFGWLSQFGGKAKIVSPENVVEKYMEFILSIVLGYRKD